MAQPPAEHQYPDADALRDHWWWRPGWRVGTRFYAWHITVEDLPSLADLVATYQDPLARFAFLDLIPRPWLHITVQGVDHVSAVSEARRRDIVSAVSRRLAKIPAPTLTFGRPVLHGEAAVIPPQDPAPLVAIRQAIRAGIEETYGPAEGDADSFRPHVSLAYVNAETDARPVRQALDSVAPDPVDVIITHASLIEMHRDHRMYEWTTVATAELG